MGFQRTSSTPHGFPTYKFHTPWVSGLREVMKDMREGAHTLSWQYLNGRVCVRVCVCTYLNGSVCMCVCTYEQGVLIRLSDVAGVQDLG